MDRPVRIPAWRMDPARPIRGVDERAERRAASDQTHVPTAPSFGRRTLLTPSVRTLVVRVTQSLARVDRLSLNHARQVSSWHPWKRRVNDHDSGPAVLASVREGFNDASMEQPITSGSMVSSNRRDASGSRPLAQHRLGISAHEIGRRFARCNTSESRRFGTDATMTAEIGVVPVRVRLMGFE